MEEYQIIDKENYNHHIIMSEEISKENEQIKSMHGMNKNKNSTTGITHNIINSDLNSMNDSELKSIAQQTNENKTEIINEKNSNSIEFNFYIF